MNKYIDISKKIGLNILNKIIKGLIKFYNLIKNLLNKTPSLKQFTKKPEKYIFYIIIIVLPFLTFFLLPNLNGFTILLLGYSIFLKYLNLCIFKKICIIKEKNKCNYDLDILRETLIFGFLSLLFLYLFKKLYDLIVN